MFTSLFFMAALLVGVPIGVCLCISGIVYIFSTGNTVLFQSFPMQMFAGVDSYGLIAIPLFILMGEILLRSGIADGMYKGLSEWLGGIRGGLLHANLGTCTLFAATTGSSVACAATVGDTSRNGTH